jgi:hypothetical protein
LVLKVAVMVFIFSKSTQIEIVNFTGNLIKCKEMVKSFK